MDRDIMRRPPRPRNEPILSRPLLLRVGFSASLVILGVLFIFARELGDGSMAPRDQTMVCHPVTSHHQKKSAPLIKRRVDTDLHFLRFPRFGIRNSKSGTERSSSHWQHQQNATPNHLHFLRSPTLPNLRPLPSTYFPNSSTITS